MTERVGPVLSPVDYNAWSKGYMPPSEHVLIDALQYRGAKVFMASDNGVGNGAFWLVIRDKRPSRAAIKRIMAELMTCFDDEDEPPPLPQTETPPQEGGE